METSGLIRHLAACATPVHRLPPPWLRTAMWLAISLPYVCAVVVMKPEAIDFLRKIDARFALEQAAILATAFTAAIAAFASVIPGRHRQICLLPLAPLAVWLASLGEGCASDWLRFGADGLQVRPDWECAPAAIFIGIIPAVAMVVMLRRGCGTWNFRAADISHRRCQRHVAGLALWRSRPDLGASRSDWTSRFELAFRDRVRCAEELLGP